MNKSEQRWPGFGQANQEIPGDFKNITASSEVGSESNPLKDIPEALVNFLSNIFKMLAGRKKS